MSTLDSGKEIKFLQVMKLLKDQDINRAVLFFNGIFKKGWEKYIDDNLHFVLQVFFFSF